MIFVEMTRDEKHGGPGWSFGECLWSPSHKRNGKIAWPFWRKIASVQQGDVILHLKGKTPNANFVGYSTAYSGGFETTRRPPLPKSWGYARSFYRADLVDYVPFETPINLSKVFHERVAEIRHYITRNKQQRKYDRKNIFCTQQSGRLQCLNGAYLSELDEGLFDALFGGQLQLTLGVSAHPVTSVTTGTQVYSIKRRIGQDKFAQAIKSVYGEQCCFPGCGVTDGRFLIAAHIARWCDKPSMRGDVQNGLCFCVFHDRAFEVGLFTIDQNLQVFVNPKERSSTAAQGLLGYHGVPIRQAKIEPSREALMEHWIRTDMDPLV